jgi:thymidine kinase
LRRGKFTVGAIWSGKSQSLILAMRRVDAEWRSTDGGSG